MVGTQWMKRRSEREKTAEQAWEYLSSAFSSAGDSAKSVGRRGSELADLAGDRVGSAADTVGTAADEAWQRANAAFDALAGRRPPTPWAWVVGAGLLGVAIGWFVASTAASRSGDEEEDRVRIVDVDRPPATTAGLDA